MELILKGRDYPAKGMKLIHDTLMADTIKIINPIMLLNEKSCPLADFVLRMVTFFRAISPLKVPCMRNSRLLTPFPSAPSGAAELLVGFHSGRPHQKGRKAKKHPKFADKRDKQYFTDWEGMVKQSQTSVEVIY